MIQPTPSPREKKNPVVSMKFMGLISWTISVSTSLGLNPRLSFSSQNEIGISWQSASKSPCDSVSYGQNSAYLNSTASASKECRLYQGDDVFHAVLTGLEPNTIYFYKILCSDSIESFRSAPRAGTEGSFSFAVYADLGPVRGKNTINALNKRVDRLVGHIFAGDIGYADDAFLHAESYISRTNEFLNAMGPSSKRVPIMVAPGNHEAEDHSPICILSPDCRHELGNFTAYNCIWNMPSEKRTHSMWYSFDYGPIHFVMIDTETDYEGAPLEGYGEIGFIPTGKFGLLGEFEEWLRNDLEKAVKDRNVRPWIIVAGHRPIEVLDNKSDPFFTPLSERMIDLIGLHADAYISGHVHYYARSSPKADSPFQAQLITVGGAGCDEWDERRVKDTRKGETQFFEFFGFGDEQTFGILSFDKDHPDELVFNLLTSRDERLVDSVILPRRKSQSHASPVIIDA